jgi:DNA-3-methyladenine glycosylase II
VTLPWILQAQGNPAQHDAEFHNPQPNQTPNTVHYSLMIHDGHSRKLPFDPEEALAHLHASDPKLSALIDRAGPFTLKLDPSPSPFESLVESILYQQLHGKAAATIHRRVREFFGGDPAPEQLISTPDEPLRACGVSGNKIKALKDLAARTLEGTVPTHAAIRKMSDAEIVERLTAVRGIGPWTVEMLLIFRLGRPDVLPVSDYGVRKGFALTFQRLPKTRPLVAEDLPKAEVLLKRGKRWAPYRSVASWYLWRACDLAKSTAPTGRSSL